MFIGHFAAGFAAKRLAPSVSLAVLFTAAQWLDLLWPVMLLFGVERVELAPVGNPTVPLAFVYYPYSHGLLMVIGWSVLAAGLYWLIRRNIKEMFVVAACVMSHWVLDLIMHEPDLPLASDSSLKLGFGLWNHKVISLLVETCVFAAGIFLYLRTTRSNSRGNRIALWSLIIFLYAIQVANYFGPAPTDMKAVAWAGLLQWIFVLWAYLVDRRRTVRLTPG